MAFSDLKPIWKTGMCLYIIGLIVYIVGFATNQWFGSSGISFGLFRVCGAVNCINIDKYDVPTNLYQPGQGLTSTGLALLVVGGALVILSAAIEKMFISPFGSGLIAVGGVLGISGVIHFLVEGGKWISGYSIYWSAIVFIASCVLEMISALLLFLAYTKRSSVTSVM